MLKKKKNDDNDLEVNLGSLSIVKKQYNSEDFNSLEQIKKIDDQDLVGATQVFNYCNNAERLQSKDDHKNTNSYGSHHELATENNNEDDEKYNKRKFLFLNSCRE